MCGVNAANCRDAIKSYLDFVSPSFAHPIHEGVLHANMLGHAVDEAYDVMPFGHEDELG